MKAIILAAGRGTRLEPYTKNLPKGMLKFQGKSLLERQVEILRSSGLKDISIVRGYKADKIKIPHVKYYENKDFPNTNMVASLMCAEKEFNGESLVCYSDIIYEKSLLEQLKKAKGDSSVLVDDSWIDYWKARLDDWESDVESLQYDSQDNIFDIGNTNCKLDEAQSRYIGLIKFSPQGAEKFKELFYKNKQEFWDSDRPWRKSKSFKKAYMTCMLQEMIDDKAEVKAEHINHGWLEFDTVEDYEKATEWIKTGKIKEFINLENA